MLGKMAAQVSHFRNRPAMRLLLLAAVLITFGRILSNDFVDWDDGTLIYDNANVTQGTLDGLARQWNWRDSHAFGLYDPLVYTTWWVLAHAARLQTPDALGATINPQIFHAANLLVHWLAGCVVLEILACLGIGGWAGFAAALLFVVHPLQTEAVAWATGMKDLLGGLLGLTCIWRYLVAVQSRGVRRRSNYIAATLLCLAALLSKPSAAVLPLIVASFEVILYRRPVGRSLLRVAPWILMAAAATGITWSIQPASKLVPWPVWSRLFMAGDALAFYLCKVILPIRLSFDYGRTPLVMLGDPRLYWNWIFPVVTALMVWRLRRPMLTAAAMVFLLGVLPVLGLAPFAYQSFSTVADRYLYVSMLGVAMAGGMFLARFGNRVIWCVAGGAIAILMSLSFVQAGRWRDTDTLYAYAMSLNPITPAHYMVAAEYAEKEASMAERRGKLAIGRGDTGAARAEDDAVRDDLQKAVGYRKDEIKYDSMDIEGHDQLANDLSALGDNQDAIEVMRQWVKEQSSLAPARRDKPGNLHELLGNFYFSAGSYALAVREYEEAMALGPDAQIKQDLDAAKLKLQVTPSR